MSIRKKGKEITLEPQRYIIGIGASAGGLEAIHELFDNMPRETGFSFVIVQHLSPDYKSLMPELLSKHTQMQISEAEDGMFLKPDCIYVIPSKKIMTVKSGFLRLTEKEPSHLPNTAIDSFFVSLAQDCGKHAIGIILSGTGTDGTKGVAAIREAGGIVVVQEPLSAKFDGMPNSAIATGHADLVLAPEMMAEDLLEFLKEAPLVRAFNCERAKDENVIHDILEFVKKATAIDFSNYKRPTITRRLAKRMLLRSIDNPTDYLHYLNSNPEEVKLLCKDFLIGVTKFFRDNEAFEELRTKVIPALFPGTPGEEATKAWVVACSTGEEAYSLAILFQEHLEKINKPDANVKIFATDIDQSALEIASRGVYSDVIVNDVSKERLHKFFTRDGNKYKIIAPIRKMVVFAQHDVLRDPPFSKLQFVSCRNMLIYMSPELQRNVLKTFHFALNKSGFLMLGPSENISLLKDSVQELNKKWKIFKTTDKATSLDREPFRSPVDKNMLSSISKGTKQKNALNNVNDIFQQVITEEHRYAGIYIDKDFEVKQAVGNFKSFLNFPDDRFNFNLLKMVSPDLSLALSTAIRKATKNNEKVITNRVKIRGHDGSERKINIIVKPYLQQQEFVQAFLFIVLQEEVSQPLPESKSAEATNVLYAGEERVTELENELKETKENLQAVVEELETSNEELQSSNEEMISANEELQSTNEELQSLNEELHTVNAEHQLKIKELIELNDDLNNYFSNSDIGQLLIDKNLLIRKFTPATKNQINLIDSDIGRSIADISNNFKELDFINNLRQVLKTSEQISREITLSNGNVYQMKISPYIKQDKTTGGLVITFINISEIKELSSLMTAVFDSSLSGIAALKVNRNPRGRIVDFEFIALNRSFENLLESGTSPVGKRLLSELPLLKKEIFNSLIEVVKTGKAFHTEYNNRKKRRWYEMIAVKMRDGIVITFTDSTEKKLSNDLLAKGYEDLKEASNQLINTNKELERSNYDLMQFASVASHDLKEPLRKIQTYGSLLEAKAVEKLHQNEQNYLEKIIRSSNRMQTLIDDVLTFSKLSNNITHFRETDLNAVITRILEDLEIIIKEKSVQFYVDEFPKIEAIPGQMNQLFQNLISNGLKFNQSPNPSIKITRYLMNDDEAEALKIEGESSLTICVQDNGIGFEDIYKEKIFGIFQRLHTTSDYEGTGIGLAICKKIVDNHNGIIRADGQLKEGAKFFITLPIRQVKQGLVPANN